MQIVNAISRQDIALVHALLSKKYPSIYADIWKAGVNMSLRISDLLSIKYSDCDLDKRLLTITEQKTKKIKAVRLNNTVVNIIKKRRADYPADTWLFQVHSNRAKYKPISRVSVARTFKEVGDTLKLNISTHSMRKSRGMALYNDGVPIEKIARVLNHSSTSSTLRYLGITAEDVLRTYDDYEL